MNNVVEERKLQIVDIIESLLHIPIIVHYVVIANVIC
jgi:hypothetical protein